MVIPCMVVLAAALVALRFAVAMVVCSDDLAVRRAWRNRGRADLPALRRLDRDLPASVPPPPAHALPTIEQVAADLRRLDRQRHTGPTTCSEAWLAAVSRAYDERLQLACRYLTVTQHLSGLDGIDRDIERVRVEGELQAAGLELRSVAHRPPR